MGVENSIFNSNTYYKSLVKFYITNILTLQYITIQSNLKIYKHFFTKLRIVIYHVIFSIIPYIVNQP